MSHGFSRFGQPAARDRLHARMRGPGTLSMLLPTIVATLFMFTVVVTLNRATSLTRGGNIVRLMNVDDVFATPQAVEQNRKKEYWELMVPPPSPEAVMSSREAILAPMLEEPVGIQPLMQTGRDTWDLPPEIPPPARPLPLIETTILPPIVAPDTSLPVATPTP